MRSSTARARQIKAIPDDGSSKTLETAHLSNFVAAVRSRKSGDLAAEAIEGHLSAACCHMANVSHRLGKQSAPEAIRERHPGQPRAVGRLRALPGVPAAERRGPRRHPGHAGPWVTFDPVQERFVDDFADEANALLRREYRAPFVVPKV